MKSKKRIVFMGSNVIGLPLLKWLFAYENAELVGVFSQPDRRSGRGKKLQPNIISEWALESGVPLLRPDKISDEETAWLASQSVDLIVVMAYGHILKRDLLAIPCYGVVNVHSSLLPKYRGASPIIGALASGDTETGATLMEIAPKMDAGRIIDQESVAVFPEDTSVELWGKIAEAAVPLVERNMDNLLSGSCRMQDQDESLVTYTRKLYKEDGQLDFNLTAEALVNRSRALQPWPGSFIVLEGVALRIGHCDVADRGQMGMPGQILKVDERGVFVQTAEGVLRLTLLQRPGGKMLPVKEFLRGYEISEGALLSFNTATPLVGPEPFPWRRG